MIARIIKIAIRCVNKSCSGWMRHMGTQFKEVTSAIVFGRNVTTYKCAKCGAEQRVEETLIK